MKDNLLKLLKMNSKELWELHDCGDEMIRVIPYIKVNTDNDAYCRNCGIKIYDYRTDRFLEKK